MKRFLLVVLLFVIAAELISCVDSKEGKGHIYESIAGHTWAGDLGFQDNRGYPIKSYISFDENGYGTDKQYNNDGVCINEYSFKWSYSNSQCWIIINYTPWAMMVSELRGVYIHDSKLEADINTTIINTSEEFNGKITLYKQ